MRIARYGGQDYLIKTASDNRIILQKITLDTTDMRTPLYMYTNTELIDEFIRRGDPTYRYRKEGENVDEISEYMG